MALFSLLWLLLFVGIVVVLMAITILVAIFLAFEPRP